MIRHIVLFSYRQEAKKEDLQILHKKFTSLTKRISEISEFEWGVNMSPENLNRGLTDGYVLSFSDSEKRDSYLVHPDHKAFSEFAGPLLEKVLVFDYVADKIR